MSLNINKNFGAISNGALAALNSHQTAMGKAITRVSTGMRVNSAADDVSAYLTSRRIKSDSDGYNALYNGIQNGSVKLNAADSAVSSVLDVLNAMKSKALQYQAASDDTSAQSSIKTEYNNLKSVLNAALDFEYNGEKILQNDGSLNFYTSLDSVVAETTYDMATLATDAAKLSSTPAFGTTSNTYISNSSGNIGVYNSSTSAGTFTYNGTVYSVSTSAKVASSTALAVTYLDGTSPKEAGFITTNGIYWNADYVNSVVGGTSYTLNVTASNTGYAASFTGNSRPTGYADNDIVGTFASSLTMGASVQGLVIEGSTYTFSTEAGVFRTASDTSGILMNGDTQVGVYTFKAGSNGAGTLSINFNKAVETGVGLVNVAWSAINGKVGSVTTDELDKNSDTIMTNLNNAIKNVTVEQAKIGSGIAAMEYSSSFLQNYANIQDNAYTNLTEADMAKEMTSYVKNNVMAQAAQAMISQANQSLAQVLNLLQ